MSLIMFTVTYVKSKEDVAVCAFCLAAISRRNKVN